ncbi:MAG: clostripain-related cysteine peptidase [Elusimicrobiota bacterium]|jgi:hypothetical protein
MRRSASLSLSVVLIGCGVFCRAGEIDFDQGRMAARAFLSPPAESAIPGKDQSPSLERGLFSPPASSPASPKEWTVLVYINGKNNLEPFGLKDVNEMEQVGSTDKVNVVVEMGRIAGSQGPDARWKGVRRYLIEKDADPDRITSKVLEKFKADMGDSRHLLDFARWGMKTFPAKRTMLIVWNHGSGWKIAPESIDIKGISYDDETGNHISTRELGALLAQLGRVDVFATDACLMQMASVAYEIKDHAEVIVGSEETEPGDGQDYVGFLRRMTASPEASAEDVGRFAVESYRDFYASKRQSTTQSALRSSAFADFMVLLDDWLRMAMQPEQKDAVASAKENALHFTLPDSKDLAHLVRLASEKSADEDFRRKSSELRAYLEQRLILINGLTGGKFKEAGGLAVYVPSPEAYNPEYSRLKWAQDTLWDEFIRMPSPPVSPTQAGATSSPRA